MEYDIHTVEGQTVEELLTTIKLARDRMDEGDPLRTLLDHAAGTIVFFARRLAVYDSDEVVNRVRKRIASHLQ